MPHRVEVTPHARRDLAGLAPDVRGRVLDKTATRGETPRPPGVVKLEGPEPVWRVRVGAYRILYDIDDAAQVVRVDAVRHRGDAYRRR